MRLSQLVQAKAEKKVHHKGKTYIVEDGRIEFADVFGEGQVAFITFLKGGGNKVSLEWDRRAKEMSFDQALRQLEFDGYEPVKP
jgi:hypothetical protein